MITREDVSYIKSLIPEIHKNSVEHGFWKGNAADEATHLQMMSCEIAEAIEEDRAGRQALWHACEFDCICEQVPECKDKVEHEENISCKHYNSKPEGWAVELIDFVIRALDYIGEANTSNKIDCNFCDTSIDSILKLSLLLNQHICDSYFFGFEHALPIAVTECVDWLDKKGIDWKAILEEKMLYNVNRPALHGKRY